MTVYISVLFCLCGVGLIHDMLSHLLQSAVLVWQCDYDSVTMTVTLSYDTGNSCYTASLPSIYRPGVTRTRCIMDTAMFPACPSAETLTTDVYTRVSRSSTGHVFLQVSIWRRRVAKRLASSTSDQTLTAGHCLPEHVTEKNTPPTQV